MFRARDRSAVLMLVTRFERVAAVILPNAGLAKFVVPRSSWYEKAKSDLKTKGRAKVGGFVLGGGSSSSSSSWSSGSSSSSSSASFSGGGGSSGDGGSSGSW